MENVEKENMENLRSNLKEIENLREGANRVTGKMVMFWTVFMTAFFVATVVHNFLIVLP